MKSNPKNYYYCGSTGNPGAGLYLDKSSLRANKYSPGKYQIEFNVISIYSRNLRKNNRMTHNLSAIPASYKFRYDQNAQRMYMERKNYETGEIKWEYLDSQDDNKLFITFGESAFYFAYNKNFYDKPVTFNKGIDIKA